MRPGPCYRAPPEPWLNQALVAHFTGHLSIATALRPHAGLGQAMDAGRGLAYARAHVFAQGGRLLASFTQEAMPRALDPVAKKLGPATAM